MTDAMEALFTYAQECLFSMIQAQEKGYNILIARDEHYEERLRDILDGPDQKILDDLIRNKVLIMVSESKAAFLAGYRLALELSRWLTPPLSWWSFSPSSSWASRSFSLSFSWQSWP